MIKLSPLRVQRAKFVTLQCFKDLPDGNLYIAESGKQIPFDIKRFYFINSLANSEAIRGQHAHKVLEQVLFCISGSFMLQLDDGTNSQKIRLKDPSCGVWMGPLLWRTMASFSYDCVILVVANRWFDESDYIRDYGSFLKAVGSAKDLGIKVGLRRLVRRR
jgi:hypothetical protein